MGNKQSTIQTVYEAARDGSPDLTDLLKRLNIEEKKTAVDKKTKDGDENATPLIIASRNGNLDSVRILLSFEADVEARGTVKTNDDKVDEDCSPLWVAAATGHLDVVKLLIDHKADVNGRNATNSTPLRAAAHDGRLDIVSYLLENGANINSTNEFESTPLMIACYKGHMDVVSYLISCGANHHLKDKIGDTCLHYAAENGHTEVVGRLLSLGVKEEQNHKRLTPLLVASSKGRHEMVEYFINRPECTKEQRIDALELLGASIANDPSSFDTENAFSFIKSGMEERYKDLSRPLLKERVEPMEAYENRRESQTLEELSLLKDDGHAIHIEGLLIKERILGTDYAALVNDIRSYGSFLADSKQYGRCIGLYIRAMEIAMNCSEPTTYELKVLVWLFAMTVRDERYSNLKYMKVVLEKLTQIFESGKLKCEQEDEEKDELLYCTLHLLILYTNVHLLESKEMLEIINIVQRILRLDIRNCEGNTLLHLATWHKTPVDEKTTGIAYKLPCVETMRLILHAGCDVNGVNFTGETPLHLAVTFKPAGCEQGEILKEMLELLLVVGADTKLINSRGLSPLDCCETREARGILSEREGLDVMNVSTRNDEKNGSKTGMGTAVVVPVATETQKLHFEEKSHKETFGEQNLFHGKENQSADLEEQEVDELYFDKVTGKIRARGEGNANLQRPLIDKVEEKLEKLGEMNQEMTQLRKKEFEDVSLPRAKEKQRRSLHRQLREIERHAQLHEDEEQEGNAKRQLCKIERHWKDAQEQLQDKEGQLFNQKTQLHELEKQLQEKEEQLINQKMQLLELEERLKEKEGQLSSQNIQLHGLEKRLNEKERQLSSQNIQLYGLEKRLNEKEGQLFSQKKQLHELEKQLKDSQVECQEKEEQLSNSATQSHEMEQHLDDAQGQLREKEEQIREKDRQLMEMTNVQEQLQERDEQVANLQHVVASLEEQLRTKEHETADWIISRGQIQLTEKCLGMGGWGRVVEGKYCGCVVAVKQIYDELLESSSYYWESFAREMNIASKCRHPCLLQFIGATNDEGSPLFVTELMETSLRKLLSKQSLCRTEVSVISLDVARALNYLHQKKPRPIIHRDISSANVLLWRHADQWRGKVSDYGTANFMQQTMTACPGTRIYSAPEALTEHQTAKVDVYSFGVLLCEICIRKQPDPDKRVAQVAMVKDSMLRVLIRRCLQEDPEERPTMENIIGELEKFEV